MTQDTSNRLIVVGFAMLYLGAMGLLLMLSSVNLSDDTLRIVRLVLASLVVLGSVVTLVGRLSPIRGA